MFLRTDIMEEGEKDIMALKMEFFILRLVISPLKAIFTVK